jgi:UDP-N-acetylmuramate: L-alanyl-gamma-D-glutamyl-meso-diaminopimelate ligase
VLAGIADKLKVESDVDSIVRNVLADAKAGDQIVMMSNGSFAGLPRLLQQALKSAESPGDR